MAEIHPNLSVVVLTCNRPEDLRRSLASVLDQDLHPSEIVVVDDGAENPEPVKALVEGAGIGFFYHRKTIRGIAGSRNIGAELSSGDFIMYLDDDEYFEPGYIREVMRTFQDPEIVAVAGVRESGNASTAGRLARVWDALERFFLLRADGHRILRSGFNNAEWEFERDTDVEWLSGTATYRRSVFRNHAFDMHLQKLSPYALGEDLEFSYAVGDEGRRVITPRALVTHHRSPTSRPPSARLARQRVFNHYYIYRRHFRRRVAHPLAFAWAILGNLVLRAMQFVVRPGPATFGSLRGAITGTAEILWLALKGGFPAASRCGTRP